MNKLPNSAAENTALDLILDLAKTEIPTIREEVFVNNYLPLLASKEVGVDLTPWLEVCGHFYRPVDVVKDGEVLYRVPALLKQTPVNSPVGPRDSVDERIKTSRLKARVHPRLGKTYFEQELGKLVGSNAPDMESLSVWNGILSRYGYEPLTNDTVDTTSPTKPVVDDVEGYDDI